jgi:tripartite-type tricarboxylate transporter receptor subunit TctC
MIVRALIFLVVAATLLAIGAPTARAQSYPVKPIRLLVGFPPGGQSDTAARMIGARLTDRLGQSIVIENRAGAGGTIAAEAMARSNADGYTLLLGSPSNITLAPLLYPDLRYDPLRDLIAIGRFARVPMVIAANAKMPFADLRQLVSYARAHPGALTCATSALSGQLAVQLLMNAAAIEIVHVPYKGSAAAVADVIAGHANFTLADFSALAAHGKAGTLRLLAVTGPKRLREAPDLPTTAEQGFDDALAYSWQAIMVPRGTPADVVAALRRALADVTGTAAFREALERTGFEPNEGDPTDVADLLREETDRYRTLVKQAGLRVDPP